MKKIIIPDRKIIMLVPDQIRPALCLDFDGTIRYSKSGEFISGPEDIVLFNDVEQKLWKYQDDGYLIFGITNQGGVAYGFKLPIDNDAEIETTCKLFKRNPFHIIKSCLHHPSGTQEPYNHRSLLRKPDIGMLALCEAESWDAGYIVDWDKSIFVGDRAEDERCAVNAGVRFIWAKEFFGR